VAAGSFFLSPTPESRRGTYRRTETLGEIVSSREAMQVASSVEAATNSVHVGGSGICPRARAGMRNWWEFGVIMTSAFVRFNRAGELLAQKAANIGEATISVVKEVASRIFPTNPNDVIALRNNAVKMMEDADDRGLRELHAKGFIVEDELISVPFGERLTGLLRNLPGQSWEWYLAGRAVLLTAGAGCHPLST
jgi:hypothetical protein